MKKNIEHEIEKTLGCLDQTGSIEVNDMFIDSVCDRLSHTRMRRGSIKGNPALYVAVAFMLVLNVMTGFMFFVNPNRPVSDSSSQLNVIADEYGLNQNSMSAF